MTQEKPTAAELRERVQVTDIWPVNRGPQTEAAA